jgi:type IV pilus assembly protein PilM
LSKGLLETVSDVFKPQAPSWACELTLSQVIIAGVNSRRRQIIGKLTSDLPPGKNLEAVRSIIRELLNHAGFKGSEIAVVVPDETSRIAFVTAEKLSRNIEEQRTFIRWKLKKSMPFDVDAAQVAFRIIGPHRSGVGVDLLVALSQRSVIQEYEALFEAMDIHAGVVVPSTLAVLNLVKAPVMDTLFLKVAPDCVTTSIFQNQRLQFYRRVVDVSLYEAVYPTILYYHDKLGGKALEQLYVCGDGADVKRQLEEIYDKLGLLAQRIEPKNVEDVFKPALGAIHLEVSL